MLAALVGRGFLNISVQGFCMNLIILNLQYVGQNYRHDTRCII